MLGASERVGYGPSLPNNGPSQLAWQSLSPLGQSDQPPPTNVAVAIYSDHGAADASAGNFTGPQPVPYSDQLPQSPSLLYRPGDIRLGQLSAEDFYHCVAQSRGLEDSSRWDFTDTEAFLAHCRSAFFDAFSEYLNSLVTQAPTEGSAAAFAPEDGTAVPGTPYVGFDMTLPVPMSVKVPQPLFATSTEIVHVESSGQQRSVSPKVPRQNLCYVDIL